MSSKCIIVVCGTTGSGKTSTSIEIARQIGGEIVNSDAFQLYSGLDIATAKVTESEKGEVPHHLLSVLPPSAETNVVSYRNMALPIIEDILLRNRIPIVIGGTNFYLESVLFESDEPALRDSVVPSFKDNIPSEYTYSTLQEINPDAAKKIHPSDARRIKRAVEVSLAGEALSRKTFSLRYPTILVHIACDTSQLTARLNDRVDAMVEAGLVNELFTMYPILDEPSTDNTAPRGLAAAIGYKEMLPFLTLPEEAENKDATLASCLQQVKTNTIKYAKRQSTWLRNRLLPACERLKVPILTIRTDDTTALDDQLLDVVTSIREKLSALHFNVAYEKKTSEFRDDNQHLLLKRHVFQCEVCDGRYFQGRQQFDVHMASKTHKKRVAALHKRRRNNEARKNTDKDSTSAIGHHS